ncbi:WAS/WASL-interacting protein family member 3-like [Zingiber officinale]|uniref:WAS/WASL-interacting protein family member 3-like n=1 Tax=Zingiber officinale TaxID=94328 RepID=UPI001C4CBB70|nr:WAS/WASL-interacting protein family member 3-like [Zingiber officinale]
MRLLLLSPSTPAPAACRHPPLPPPAATSGRHVCSHRLLSLSRRRSRSRRALRLPSPAATPLSYPLLSPPAVMPARTACSPSHVIAHAPVACRHPSLPPPCCHLRLSCPLAPPAQLPPSTPAPPPQHFLVVDTRPLRSTNSARSDQRN